jgi:nitroreductase
MNFTTNVSSLIRRRHSCRTYQDRPIGAHEQRLLLEFLAANRAGPLGNHARFVLVAATDADRRSLKDLGTYGFVRGATGFVVGAIGQGLHHLEDYGHLLEQAVLFATDLGLGTCWLGGSFSRSSFARKVAAAPDELVPAVIAIGYGAKRGDVRGRIRAYARNHERLGNEHLFYGGQFGQPLAMDQVGAYATALEAVRWAPSASNKQPWRVVRTPDAWHFYLRRTQGYGQGTLLFSLLGLADLQRVDMGIAMCHFELVARELGLGGSWVLQEPELENPDPGTEYVVSWRVGETDGST